MKILMAAIVTMVLCGLFWAPLGGGGSAAGGQISLAGRTLTFESRPTHVPASAPPSGEPAPPLAPPAPEAAKPEPPRKRGSRRSARIKSFAGHAIKQAAPALELTPEAPTATSVPISATPNVTAEALVSQSGLQDLEERFENDPSRYPIDRRVKKDGVTLSLEALARFDKGYVLKISVTNETGADFFIKNFAVQAGTVLLESRSDFRILVEPQRARSGYVVFERPKHGMSVNIKLKEDGGRGRIIQSSVPYPF